MDLRMGASRSERPDSRQAILRAALLDRRAQLRRSWRHLLTVECLQQLGSTATKVADFLSGPDAFYDWRTATVSQWRVCDASLSACLISIGVGEKIACPLSAAEPTAFACADFKKLSTKDRVEALSVRYRCPLNVGTGSESEIAEELLRQLMVVDRVKLEAAAEFEVDEVLLKLNLVAVRAMVDRDLRFLDALNYFYELPQRSLARLRRHPPLLAAWLCIYAQLLCAPDWAKCASL
jgi:hypothetical protein